ncbi:hypothetical protein JRO89_XS05G0265600 [Xanthoceras sorbifolium]|uniref:Uncharacterized protein n=1 Tax=Xanthoceras sorbifolium TaxID=99658 RepID=A0ABQ8I3J0_9ROSI|nr:hypothetical protein JRO89_XS05G0265600 [Xanthoceras sorbifolium]
MLLPAELHLSRELHANGFAEVADAQSMLISIAFGISLRTLPHCGLSNLEYFKLYNNTLKGTISSSLFALPSLIEIDLSNNQLEAIDIT